ncbi:MAG TPA: hypothetical protein VFG73_01645 [Rhodanobacteraceae bacterium]|nr:hypothetical protein [Rhodanobacteraceae bacterium]
MNTRQNAESIKGKASDMNSHVERGAEHAKVRGSEAIDAARDAAERTGDRAERALHHAADTTTEAARHAARRASELTEKGREKWAQGRAQAEEGIDHAVAYVRSNPGKAVAMAVAGGWLLGALMRRRH